MHRLTGDLIVSKKSAFAPGTRSNLLVQWQSYILFCLYFGFQFIPATCHILCLFAQFLSRSFKSVGSIKNYISGIKLLHAINDAVCPSFSNIDLRLSLRGIARLNPHKPRQALPMTPILLCKLFDTLDFKDVKDTVMWAVSILAFFTLARKSNLVAKRVGIGCDKQLTRGDIVVAQNCLLVKFRWSKTIQYGERQIITPVLGIKNSKLCPVRAYKRMLKQVPGPASQAAFVFPTDSGNIPVTYAQFQSFLRHSLQNIGVDASKYSSHSFRRGGASWAFQCGLDPELVQVLGDWHSDSYRNYRCLSMRDKMLMASKLTQKLQFQV